MSHQAQLDSDAYPCHPVPVGKTCASCRHLQRCVDGGFTHARKPLCAFEPGRYWPVQQLPAKR